MKIWETVPGGGTANANQVPAVRAEIARKQVDLKLPEQARPLVNLLFVWKRAEVSLVLHFASPSPRLLVPHIR